MSLTLQELIERLATRLDEITILEVLEINSEELCDRFYDKIQEKFEELEGQMSEDE